MPIPPEEVRRIATLANLELSPEEISRYSHDLFRILDYIDQLKEVDTGETPPLVHVFERRGKSRPDVTGPCLQVESILKNALDHQGDLFKVPRVIE